MTSLPLARGLTVSALIAAFACAGCAEDEIVTVDGGLGYSIEFPSTQAAVATESLKIYVYAGDQDCLALIQARQSGGALPAALAETPAAPVCDYFGGSAGGDIELEAGDYKLLAVGQRESKDFLIGCAATRVDAQTEQTPVPLGLADVTSPVPSTSCNLLSDKCGGRC